MKAQLLIVAFLLSSVLAEVIWFQPPLERNAASSDSMLLERGVAYGVAAPRSFSAPDKSGFNFDSFAADDFFVNSFTQVNELWIAIGVDQLDSYTIDSVFIGIYPDVSGLPNYDPYSPDSPAPAWSHSFEWVSDDPDAHYPAPWLSNPLRKGAINVAVDFSLLPGVYWLTMHFEISASSISIPPATWLPGKTQGDSGSPARLYVPGNNPSAGSANAFGWFWNTLRRTGLGDLSFKIDGPSSNFSLVTNALDDMYFFRCSGEAFTTVNISALYFDTNNWNDTIFLGVTFPPGSPLSITWEGPDNLTSTAQDTSFRIMGMSQGNEYNFTLNATAADGSLLWMQDFKIRAVADTLSNPNWVTRDEYGLIGGLFQWNPNSISENFDFEIDEDGGDFSNPELSTTLPGTQTSYRPTLADFDPTGNVSMFVARPQDYWQARVRAVNPDCNQTSDWVTIRFQSDECELTSATFLNGTYNFKKGKFVTNTWLLSDYGTIMDLRVRVRGFHQRWSDVGLAIKTPVVYEGHTVDVPLFAEDCNINWDTHHNNGADHFEIYFVIGGADDSLCPRPPLEGEPSNSTHVEPWGAQVWKQLVAGQDKRGYWALEWIDYGIGFPTNGKISDYDVLLCSIPVAPREHIVYKGESKVRRGTMALYGP